MKKTKKKSIFLKKIWGHQFTVTQKRKQGERISPAPPSEGWAGWPLRCFPSLTFYSSRKQDFRRRRRTGFSSFCRPRKRMERFGELETQQWGLRSLLDPERGPLPPKKEVESDQRGRRSQTEINLQLNLTHLFPIKCGMEASSCETLKCLASTVREAVYKFKK